MEVPTKQPYGVPPGTGTICAIIHRFLDRDTPDLRIRGSVFLSANLQCGNMGHLTDSRIGTFRI